MKHWKWWLKCVGCVAGAVLMIALSETRKGTAMEAVYWLSSIPAWMVLFGLIEDRPWKVTKLYTGKNPPPDGGYEWKDGTDA